MSDLYDLYQELILDHNRRPRNRGKLAHPTGRAEGYNPLCGDRVTVYIETKDDTITDLSFEGSGCAISTASASLMTQSLKGKTIDEARSVFREFHDMLVGTSEPTHNRPELGKLTAFSGVAKYPARVKCATLAWHTLKQALDGNKEMVSTE